MENKAPNPATQNNKQNDKKENNKTNEISYINHIDEINQKNNISHINDKTKDYNKEELSRLKQEVAILPLAGSMDIEFKKVGSGEFAGLCPFHADKNPSLHVNVIKNLFHCKGCGKAGSVIDWVMLTKNLDTAGAIKYLRESNVTLDRAFFALKKSEAQEERKIDIREPRFQKALRLVVEFYHQNLLNKKEGTAYLLKRKLIYGEIAREFKIGYSDGSLIDLLNDDEIIDALFDLGLVWAEGDTLKERFIGRVVFPVIDEDGIILQLYGRNTTSKGPKHMYLRAPLVGLYNQRSLVSSEVILAECFIDALSLIALGHQNVCASYGINGLTGEALRLFYERGVQKVYFAYDADDQAETAIEKYSTKLIEDKIETFRIDFGSVLDEGQKPINDANELLTKAKSIEEAKEVFARLLENAKPIKQLTDTASPYHGGRFESLEKRSKDHKEYFYRAGKREYVIRGLDQNKTNSQLKIFLRLDYEADPPGTTKRFHIDNNLDLFNAKSTGTFSKAAATRLNLDERVIRADLDSLTAKLDEILQKVIEEKENSNKPKQKEFHQNLAQSQKAKELLCEPLYILKFLKDMEKAGVVGEPLNMFVGYLSTLSRHMKNPLHLIIQSESSSGKSNMLNLLSKLVPEEDTVYFTQVTPRSFYYGDPDFLKNKSIFIAEADGLREAEFPIKQMMSEGRLAISSTKTDPKTGEHTSDSREVEGPAQFIITEPIESLNQEIINRSLTLILDMSLEQTERIMAYQRLLHSVAGVELRNQRDFICDFYRHVQRELIPLEVINPYSEYLSFNAKNHQARRDHQKYLTLLDCISLLFQHQREKVYKDTKTYVKTHLNDIALCNFIAGHIFSYSLEELAPQTMNFTRKLTQYVLEAAAQAQLEFENFWFYRKDARRITGLSNTRVHAHINVMVDHELLTTKRDQNGIAYRFIVKPQEDGTIGCAERLNLVRLSQIQRHATKKERQEYKDFIPLLKQIYKALIPSWEDKEGEK